MRVVHYGRCMVTRFGKKLRKDLTGGHERYKSGSSGQNLLIRQCRVDVRLHGTPCMKEWNIHELARDESCKGRSTAGCMDAVTSSFKLQGVRKAFLGRVNWFFY